jgi:hypothetical protein
MFFFVSFIKNNQTEMHVKGQLISKCPFGVYKNFVRISALASKTQRSN